MNFINSFVNCYIIWFVVNWFDVFVLDMWILANWKKCRLPGTEHMDRALVVGGLTEILF